MTEAVEKGLKKIGITISKPILAIIYIIFGILVIVYKESLGPLARVQLVSLKKTVVFVQAVRLLNRWDSRISFSVQETLKRNKEECNLRTYLFFQRF